MRHEKENGIQEASEKSLFENCKHGQKTMRWEILRTILHTLLIFAALKLLMQFIIFIQDTSGDSSGSKIVMFLICGLAVVSIFLWLHSISKIYDLKVINYREPFARVYLEQVLSKINKDNKLELRIRSVEGKFHSIDSVVLEYLIESNGLIINPPFIKIKIDRNMKCSLQSVPEPLKKFLNK